jgi:hypothetical protein
MADNEFLARTSKLGLPVQPAYGDAVLAMVTQALDQKPETVALLAKALERPKK